MTLKHFVALALLLPCAFSFSVCPGLTDTNPTQAVISDSPNVNPVEQDATASSTASPDSAVTPLDNEPPYQQASVKKGNLFRGIIKGLGKELGQNVEYMAKDSAFVFSAQDYDANKTKAPKGKPYEDYHIRWSDGTRSSIVRYPDGKQVIATGHRSGTVFLPLNRSTYDIVYPSGKHGTLSKDDNGGYQLKRYDGTVITLSPKMTGGWYISSQAGELGSIEPSVVDKQYGFYSSRDMDF